MGKKEQQFSKSEAWLDWLSDGSPKKMRPANGQGRPHQPRPYAAQARTTPSTHAAPVRRTLGLRPEMFTTQPAEPAAAPPKQSKIGKRFRPSKPQPVLYGAGRADDGNIAIHIDLPKFQLPSMHIPWKKVFKWGSVALVVALVIIGTPTLIRHQTTEQKKKAAATAEATPVYSPLKPEQQVSGAQYDGKRKLYKYDDTYKGLTITVSQQPLPENLRDNPAKVKQLAEGLGTVESFETTNGTMYIASGEESNTQRVVVAHRQLLIFLQSNGTLSPVDWVAYVQNLD